MASLTFIIGIIGNVISILVFTSPMAPVHSLLSTSLWTFYGILKPGGMLVSTVNGAGALLQFIYVVLFLVYATKEKKIKSMKLVALLDVGFLGLVIAVTLLGLHGKLRITFVGIISACLNLGMYGSPLAVMMTVIKTKSVKYMPFLLSFFLFLNGGIWSVYALLDKDLFLGVPNSIGFVLSTAQLILYFMYKNKSLSEKPDENAEKQGESSAHLVKEGVEMQGECEDDQSEAKSCTLTIGGSLPKPPILQQHSIGKLMITVSSSLSPPNEQHSEWNHDKQDVSLDDLESGKKDGS